MRLITNPAETGEPVRRWQFILFWIAAALLFFWLLSILGDVTLPFMIGIAIAYLMNPLTERLVRTGMPRWAATSVALLLFTLAGLLAFLLMMPIVISQVSDLIVRVPQWIAKLRQLGEPLVDRFFGEDATSVANISQALNDNMEKALNVGGAVVAGLISSSFAVFSLISILVITPVVAFYLLRDWPGLVKRVDDLLPRQQAPVIRRLGAEVDRTLAGFLRGQASVCLILGFYYALALTLVGVPSGFFIGLTSGLLSFIPYVGSLFGFFAGTIIAYVTFGSWIKVGVVVALFMFGQFLEGYVLAPKLVGDRVGLHPVWIIFALMAGGSLFGFAGLLLAVPVAAVLGVLIRFGVGQYRTSPYYTGIETTIIEK